MSDGTVTIRSSWATGSQAGAKAGAVAVSGIGPTGATGATGPQGPAGADGSSVSLPVTVSVLSSADETKILLTNTHPTMNYIFTSNLQTSAGSDFPNLVYQDWAFNGNADGRTNPALPSMSSDIEGCWSPGPDSWIFEPHMLKVNVGSPGSTLAVRADTWYIPNPNKATYYLQHIVSAHAHEFMCFTQANSGGTVDSNHVLRLSKGSISCYAGQIGIYEDADQIRIATDGQRLQFSANQIDLVGFDYAYETAGTVTFKKPTIFRNYGDAGGTRVTLEPVVGGNNNPVFVATERDSGGNVSWSGGFNANGQVMVGWVTDPTVAGNRRGFYAKGSGSFNELAFCDSNGNVFDVIQSAVSSKPTVTGSRGGNAALASLLTTLASLRIIVDGTTA